jgi:hypothetical protein
MLLVVKLLFFTLINGLWVGNDFPEIRSVCG